MAVLDQWVSARPGAWAAYRDMLGVLVQQDRQPEVIERMDRWLEELPGLPRTERGQHRPIDDVLERLDRFKQLLDRDPPPSAAELFGLLNELK